MRTLPSVPRTLPDLSARRAGAEPCSSVLAVTAPCLLCALSVSAPLVSVPRLSVSVSVPPLSLCLFLCPPCLFHKLLQCLQQNFNFP